MGFNVEITFLNDETLEEEYTEELHFNYEWQWEEFKKSYEGYIKIGTRRWI